MLSSSRKFLMLAAIAASAHAQDNSLPGGIDECLQKSTYTERQSCLQMNIDLLRLQQELTSLATYGDTDKTKAIDYDVPQPIALQSGPKMRARVDFAYQGGVVSGGIGDVLAAGWKIKRIGNASVTLSRKGRDIVLGYSSAGGGGGLIPLMDTPLVAAPARPQDVRPAQSIQAVPAPMTRQ